MNIGRFHKMHGLGNDFIIVDERTLDKPLNRDRISAMSNRYTGIGCDQFIILNDSSIADIQMQIYNNDGSKAAACGNASRCIVALFGKNITIETEGGLISGEIDGGLIQMNMGKPRFDWQAIPLSYAMDSANLPLAWDDLANGFCVNVGNPHIIFFVDDYDRINLAQLGPLIENDSIFPEHINVNVAVIDGNDIILHVWERGAGLTLACGTGACATAVAAISKKLISSPVNVILPGGTLSIAWEKGGDIIMSGDAVHVFRGETDWDVF